MSLFTRSMRRGLAWGLAAALALPWLIGEWVKTTLQPGIADAAANASRLVDYVVIGAVVFDLSMWLVAAFACWIICVMKGPRRLGDAFPADEPRSAR
jgi:hypothetical protein